MADIEITKDRDVLAALALLILEKSAALSRRHDVTVPKKFMRDLRQRARRTARVLGKAKTLRDKADALSHSADADVRAIESAVRNIGQSIVRQAGTEAAKEWGFQFGAGRRGRSGNTSS